MTLFHLGRTAPAGTPFTVVYCRGHRRDRNGRSLLAEATHGALQHSERFDRNARATATTWKRAALPTLAARAG